MDLLGRILRQFPRGSFRGQGRLVQLWKATRSPDDSRIRTLFNGGKIKCYLSIPYEAKVWLRREDQEDLKALSQLLASGDTFVDIGANIGLWTITAAMEVGPTGEVHSFEPNPSTFDKLLRNVEASDIGNVRAKKVALGQSRGDALLHCNGPNSRVSSGSQAGGREVEVPVRALDDLLGAEGRIDGCKIDVEGYELNVLRGMKELLQNHHPWICVEFNTKFAETNRLRDWHVHEFLTGRTYSAYLFGDALEKKEELDGSFTLDSKYVNLLYR